MYGQESVMQRGEKQQDKDDLGWIRKLSNTELRAKIKFKTSVEMGDLADHVVSPEKC